MDGLLSLLLFAGFFYLMMRFGCGAHMVHGHGNSNVNKKMKNHNDRDESHNIKHIDPVCGMEVDADKGYGKMHQGQLYRFCHRNCLDKFESNPEKYLKKEIEVEGGEV